MAPTHILQRALDNAINHPSFAARLPPLSEKRWMDILSKTYEADLENDRLEFVGDALMYAALARQMYQQYPRGSPHFYTCLRAALNSNATFSHIAEKMEFYCVSHMVLRALTERTFGEGSLVRAKSRGAVKLTADLFETMVAAYYWEAGFEALFKWVREIYRPLISATADEYYNYRRYYGPTPPERRRDMSTLTRFAPGRIYPGPRIRPLVHVSPVKRPSSQVTPIKHRLTGKSSQITPIKLRLQTGKTRSSLTPHMKRSVLGSPKSAKDVKQAAPKKPPAAKSGQAAAGQVAAVQVAAVQMAASTKRAIYIDLTQDSDSDSGDEGFPSKHTTQATILQTCRVGASAMVSKQSTAFTSTPALPPGLQIPAIPAGSSGALKVVMSNAGRIGSLGADSDSEDEMLLVTMLTTESDMDCSSSDVEWPCRRLTGRL